MFHVQGLVEKDCILVVGEKVVGQSDSLYELTNRARYRSKKHTGEHEVYRMETRPVGEFQGVTTWVLKKCFGAGVVAKAAA